MLISVRPFDKCVSLKMALRKTKESRSVRETKEVVLSVKQRKSPCLSAFELLESLHIYSAHNNIDNYIEE